ncbi:MAG: MXAN_6640 family putative metalloprotease [bacterium]
MIKITASLVITVLCLLQSAASAQPLPSGRFSKENLSPAALESLFMQAIAILPAEKVPPEYRIKGEEPFLPRCGTIVLQQVRNHFDEFDGDRQAVLQTLFARPTLPLHVVSASGRFRFHYADSGLDAVPLEDLDGNGRPDYIDAVEAAFEKSYAFEIDQLGYLEPPADNGVDGPEYDVYIHNLSAVYGLTTTDGPVSETQQNDRITYIEIDNDYAEGFFTSGVPGAQVTAAHEYFHAIQFSYRTIMNSNEIYYYELCSIWMEDIVYDEINDYLQYQRFFFNRPDISFNRFDPFSHYLGESLWNHFLVKKTNKLDIMSRTWEIMLSNVVAIDAVKQALFENNIRLTDAFAEYSIWNYFTGSRADTVRFYEESNLYNREIRLAGDFTVTSDTTISDSSLALTAQYYRFTAFESGDFLIGGSVDNPDFWKFGVITTPPGGSSSFEIFDPEDGVRLPLLPQFTEIVIVPINVRVLDGPDLNLLTRSYSRFTFNLIRVPSEGTDVKGITSIYPIPFIIPKHARLRVEFLPSNTSDLEVQVLTSDGRVIRTDKLGSTALTPTSFQWDGTDANKERVPSGIYIVLLKQDNFTQIKKIAIIRE